MKKLYLLFSLVLGLLVVAQNGYANDDMNYNVAGGVEYDQGQQWGGPYDQGQVQGPVDNSYVANSENSVCDQPAGPCVCYCLRCRYVPEYYCVRRCEYCPQYHYKKCCRYVPQYYQKCCCRYVPQYYYKTCCKQVPQYYYTCDCTYCPKYHYERRCRMKPCYYYQKTTSCPTGTCGAGGCAAPAQQEGPCCPQGGYNQGGFNQGGFNQGY